MKNLTINELNLAIEIIGDLPELVNARNYMLGLSKEEPADPRLKLIELEYTW